MELNFLAALGPEEREDLLARCLPRRFWRRQPLFEVDDPSDGMYLIMRGRVLVKISTPGGEQAAVTVIGPGDSLGEQSLLLEGGRRSASAVALDEVETQFLASTAFAELRQRGAAFNDALTRLLANRVLRLSDQLTEALFVPATTRVLRRVAETAAFYGAGSIPLTQEEVATMAGTTRPTVNRVLRSAEEKGVIDLARGQIRVVDVAGLKALCG